MTHYPFWPITIVALLVVFTWAGGRLKRKAQPLRLKLADKAGFVLSCPDTSENGRHLVNMYLDSAFSFRAHLMLAHFVVPALAISRVVRVLRDGKEATERRERNPQVHAAIEEMTEMHLRITLANHPLLCSSVLLSVVCWFTLAYALIALIGGVIPSRMHAEEIAEQLDHAYARIPVRLRGTGGHAHGCA